MILTLSLKFKRIMRNPIFFTPFTSIIISLYSISLIFYDLYINNKSFYFDDFIFLFIVFLVFFIASSFFIAVIEITIRLILFENKFFIKSNFFIYFIFILFAQIVNLFSVAYSIYDEGMPELFFNSWMFFGLLLIYICNLMIAIFSAIIFIKCKNLKKYLLILSFLFLCFLGIVYYDDSITIVFIFPFLFITLLGGFFIYWIRYIKYLSVF